MATTREWTWTDAWLLVSIAVVDRDGGAPLTEVIAAAVATNRDSMVYDARGIGYGASNLSVVIRRGRAVDTVVVSRLGRVRW